VDLPASVEVVEVGPRDGLQSEKTNLPTPEKTALIEAFAAAGLKRCEAVREAGITTFDASVGGLGGSPNAPWAGGNAATEDLVYMLTEMGIETGVALEPLMDAADLLERLVGHPLKTRIERSLLADSGLR
jgi:isopropylmalate/homocitrate/citramalate synthase